MDVPACRYFHPDDTDIIREVQSREAYTHIRESSQGTIWARAAHMVSESDKKRQERRESGLLPGSTELGSSAHYSDNGLEAGDMNVHQIMVRPPHMHA